MEILLAVVLLALLLLPAQLLGSQAAPGWVPQRVRRLGALEEASPTDAVEAVTPGAGADAGEVATGAPQDWALFDRELIRRRLDALTEELDRLDRDPDVFAKAFHTSVARAAYDALLAEAEALPAQPCWEVGRDVEVELLAP